MRVRSFLLVTLACGLAALIVASSASAKRPTCSEIRSQDYEMFSKAGDRAVGRVVASVSPPCRQGRKLKLRVMTRRVRSGLTRVGRTHPEVSDSAVVEAVADALHKAGAGYVGALIDIWPD